MAFKNNDAGYNGNPNLKLPGTQQSFTMEQLQELYRCSIDPIYWAEKYIKIVSVDHGVIPIKLYDFQKEIIESTLNNRRTIVLTGRQQGKCIKGDTLVNVKNKKSGEIYEIKIGAFHEWQQFKNNIKDFLVDAPIDIVNKLSDTISRKFVEVFEIDEWEVLSDTGYVPITHSNKTIEYRVYSVSLDNGHTIQCADDHIFIDVYGNEIFAKDTLGVSLTSINGPSKVINVSDCGYSEHMYDLSIDSESHTYYTNGILSHNTTVATIILLHFALFNNAKRIGLLSNKADSSREILDRIQMAYENLPKWMQIGVKEWNKGSVEFANESRIIAAASSSSSIRGKAMAFLYIDETAFLDNWTDFYASTFPTISSGKTTKMLFTSTPNGLNHYYDFWKGATEGTVNEQGIIEKNGFIPIFAPWYKIPGRDDKWKQDTLKALNYDFDRFRQEYEGEFLRVFWNSFKFKYIRTLTTFTTNNF